MHTIEVKVSHSADVTAVHEALAHGRSAHRRWVLVIAQGADKGPWCALKQPALTGSGREAPTKEQVAVHRRARHLYRAAFESGVGVIVVPDPQEFGGWEMALPAAASPVSDREVDDFLSRQLSDEAKEQLSTRLRGLP